MRKVALALSLFILLCAFPTRAFAQRGDAEAASSSILEMRENTDAVQAQVVENQINSQASQNEAVTKGIAPALVNMLIGNPKLQGIGYMSDGGIGTGTKVIANLYHQPASAQTYIADLMNSAGIATPVYAQGLGFSALNPILETWKVFRNLSYFFFVIIFLAIGFMIMLRQKIGSQTVVTAQQALPKIIVALITVTFSYAIAGLLIDLMYVIMYLLIALFSEQLKGTGLDNPAYYGGVNINIVQLGGLLLTGKTLPTVADTVQKLIGSALGGQPGTVGDAGAQFLGWIGGLTGMLIFGLAMVFSLFRLFFELLKTYVSIVISIVLAPVALMMGALPGNNAFQTWLKGLIYNLAVFPAILVVIILAFIFQKNTAGTGGFVPPYLGGNGTAGAVSGLLGLGVMLVLPEVAVQVKKLGGSSSIFEQFGGAMFNSLKSGWSGGKLVPGLGFTDLSKLPGGGLTAGNITRKAAIGAGLVGGSAAGLGLSGAAAAADLALSRTNIDLRFGARPLEGFQRGGKNLAGFIANKTQDPQFGKKKK